MSTRRLRGFLALDDFEGVARRRLPRQVHGYDAGRAEANQSREGNHEAFRRLALVPRVLRDVSRRSPAASLFGTRHRFPFGIALMGLSGLACFEADLVRAVGRCDGLSWDYVELIRRRWRGRLALNGALAAGDSRGRGPRRRRRLGVEPRRRQLDGALALPAVRAAAGGLAALFESGLRHGGDVIEALALGADFVCPGRPFLFAAAVAAEAGVRHAVGLLGAEVDRNIAMLGVAAVGEVGREHVVDAHPPLGTLG